MEKGLEKEASADTRHDEGRDERASNGKKTYRRPMLVKHDQLHGIGLGS